ncbi:hypothetical protein, partial [Microbulbifer discodermiae]|uniref:hypothetical protein n=1 Tax=Microbulbifer sp. 2201CG32-9 TaxID=3232309 RepID=UPI00345B6BE0
VRLEGGESSPPRPVRVKNGLKSSIWAENCGFKRLPCLNLAENQQPASANLYCLIEIAKNLEVVFINLPDTKANDDIKK